MPSLTLCAILAVSSPASVMENLAALSSNRTVTAEYRQERGFKGTPVVLTVKGTMSYEREKGLVWSTDSPVKTKTVILRSSLRQWSAETGKTSEIAFSDVPFLKAMLDCQDAWFAGDLKALKGFEVKATGDDSVELVATDRPVKEIFPRMKIRISGTPPSVREVELFEKSGDRITLRFSNVKNNVDLPQSVWECP